MKHGKFINVCFLQGVILLYTVCLILSKKASGEPFLSLSFCLLFGLEFVVMAVYALLWQQVIKRMELSVAYVNRAMSLVWSMLWAFFLFGERMTPGNAVGVVCIVTGVIVLNTGMVDTKAGDLETGRAT